MALQSPTPRGGFKLPKGNNSSPDKNEISTIVDSQNEIRRYALKHPLLNAFATKILGAEAIYNANKQKVEYVMDRIRKTRFALSLSGVLILGITVAGITTASRPSSIDEKSAPLIVNPTETSTVTVVPTLEATKTPEPTATLAPTQTAEPTKEPTATPVVEKMGTKMNYNLDIGSGTLKIDNTDKGIIKITLKESNVAYSVTDVLLDPISGTVRLKVAVGNDTKYFPVYSPISTEPNIFGITIGNLGEFLVLNKEGKLVFPEGENSAEQIKLERRLAIYERINKIIRNSLSIPGTVADTTWKKDSDGKIRITQSLRGDNGYGAWKEYDQNHLFTTSTKPFELNSVLFQLEHPDNAAIAYKAITKAITEDITPTLTINKPLYQPKLWGVDGGKRYDYTGNVQSFVLFDAVNGENTKVVLLPKYSTTDESRKALAETMPGLDVFLYWEWITKEGKSPNPLLDARNAFFADNK